MIFQLFLTAIYERCRRLSGNGWADLLQVHAASIPTWDIGNRAMAYLILLVFVIKNKYD